MQSVSLLQGVNCYDDTPLVFDVVPLVERILCLLFSVTKWTRFHQNIASVPSCSSSQSTLCVKSMQVGTKDYYMISYHREAGR